jgi:small subunit ribosomal protein S4e
MSHLKRLAMPKTWPIPKTGTKYLAMAMPGRRKKFSIPLVIVLRDILKIANTRNETQKILSMKEVLVNGKIVRDHKMPLGLFDIISIPKLGKNYVVIFNEHKKISLEETKNIDQKIYKVVGKKILAGKKQQINLFGGVNILSNEKLKVNDSIIVSLKDNKILKVLPLKEKARLYVMGGKHLGEKGTIEKIADNEVIANIEKKQVNIKTENLIVTE